MTDRLTYDQRYNAITAIAAHRTERATPVDWKVFYYEHKVRHGPSAWRARGCGVAGHD